MKHLLQFLFLLITTIGIFSFKNSADEKIQWITVEELNTVFTKTPKPILIDIYTDWCGWCKQMDKTTYNNKKLAAYVNSKYYAIKFNAEQKTPIIFNGKTFNYNSQYRTHELAIYLTNGQLSYPTTVFMSGLQAQPAALPGYMKPTQMEAPLKFFGEKADVTQTFVAFNNKLKKEW